MESSKVQHLFEIEIFCNIINALTVTGSNWLEVAHLENKKNVKLI